MRSRMVRFGVALAAALVIFVGISTLFGLLLGTITVRVPESLPALGGAQATLPLDGLALFFLRIAVVTVALTILSGFLNLFAVHSGRLLRGRTLSARLSSLVLLASFLIGLLVYILDQSRSAFLLEEVQIPLESAVAGLLFFALVFGGSRLMKDRVTPARALFLLTVLLLLLGALPFPGQTLLQQITDWVLDVPVNAGGRGILLGIALATLVVGLRILTGQDRTYGE